MCPGFGQDRVNFHRTPGRGTARGWGLTAKQSRVFHTMCHHVGFWRRGKRRSGDSHAAGEHAAPALSRREGLLCEFVLCFLLICIVIVTVPFVCCSVKLPLSRPTGFCLFLSILLRTAAGGGVAAWCFCCQRQLKPKLLFGVQEWGGDNGRAEQQVLKQLS